MVDEFGLEDFWDASASDPDAARDDAGALQVHGLTAEFLRGQPRFADIAAEWIEFYRQFWEDRLASLERFVTAPRSSAKKGKRP